MGLELQDWFGVTSFARDCVGTISFLGSLKGAHGSAPRRGPQVMKVTAGGPRPLPCDLTTF